MLDSQPIAPPAPWRTITAQSAVLGAFLLLLGLDPNAFPRALPVAVSLLAIAALLLPGQHPALPGARLSSGPGPVRLAALCLVGLILVTLIPLPASVAPLLGSQRHAASTAALDAVSTASALGMTPPVARIIWLTRNVAGTCRMALLALLVFLAADLAHRASPSRRTRGLATILIAGTLTGAAAIVGQWFMPQGQTLWWVLPAPDAFKPPSAGFSSRNHLAAFMALLAGLPWLIDSGSSSRGIVLRSLLGTSFCVLAGACMLSLSRGGAIALTVALLMTAFILFVQGRRLAAGISLLALLAAGCLALQVPSVRERLASLTHPTGTHSFTTRTAAWGVSLAIWRDHPLMGVGANAFRTVYPQYRAATSSAHMTHAENEYVQSLAEGGLAGTTILAVLLALLARQAVRSRNNSTPYGALPWYGLAVAAVNSLYDFPLHVPVYAITLAWWVGTGVPPANAADSRSRAFSTVLPLLGILLAVPSAIAGDRCLSLDSPDTLARSDARTLSRALIQAPTSWHAWYYLGRQAALQGTLDGLRFAEHCLSQAVRCDPNNRRVWSELAQVQTACGHPAAAAQSLRKAESLQSWRPPLPGDAHP